MHHFSADGGLFWTSILAPDGSNDPALNSSQQDSAKRDQQTWAMLCRAFRMSNEFIYLR